MPAFLLYQYIRAYDSNFDTRLEIVKLFVELRQQ